VHQPEPRRWGLLCGALLGSLSLLVAWLQLLRRRRPPPASSPPAPLNLQHLDVLEARLDRLEQRQLELAANLEQANLAFRRLAARVQALAAPTEPPLSAGPE
jgi:hypothetical protein